MGFVSNVNIVAENIEDVTIVKENIEDVEIVADNIEDVKIVAEATPTLVENIDAIVTDAENIDSINIVAEAIEAGAEIGIGGQYYGRGVVKPIGFVSNTTVENDAITIVAGTNAFAIDNLTVAEGSSITVAEGAVFKIL